MDKHPNHDFEMRLHSWLEAVNAYLLECATKNSAPLVTMGQYDQLKLFRGPKFIKVVAYRVVDPEAGGSVFCFLDYAGNIYKAATWKAPAKGARGTIFDDNYSIGRGITQYGGAYAR